MRYDLIANPFAVVLTAENDVDLSTLASTGPSRYLTKRLVDGALRISSLSIVQEVGDLLRVADGEDVSLRSLATALSLPALRVSTALNTLKESGLAESRRHGSWRWKGGR